jgi:acetyl-CoA carboxylase biotin carboxylase subunit
VIRKLLIANRGEIAVRVIRACQDMDIGTVAVYSSVDRDAPHVRRAHEAYLIGPGPATESYLRIDKLIDVAKRAGADAIHPGYGFLAENPEFADACKAADLIFVGPPGSAMRAMGDKVEARRRMIEAGVPVLPGTGAFTGTAEQAVAEASEIGFPVMVKAAAGGGGKGMRVVHSKEELPSALERARSEAKASFADETVYIEKFVQKPRHIEVQVLFDADGNGLALGERECSIQRRHQKLVEETPSPCVGPDERIKLGELALAAAAAAGYVNAGTVEFLRDVDGSFYFREVNARLQVEHRGGLRLRPGQGADPRGGGQATAVAAGRDPPAGPRRRMPHHGGGSGPQFHALPRADRGGPVTERARHPGRLGGRSGILDPARVRPDGRQADHLGSRP